MHKSEYSSIDSTNGNVSWKGPLSVEKGDHSGMPPRTDAYLPGDEKGHVNASSLAGDNSEANVVAQNKDLNHGGYLSIERGERDALQNGADIYSEKTAIVDSQPVDRPSTFIVNDTVTYADGHSENIYNSFTNESNANQVEWNDMSSSLPDTYDAVSYTHLYYNRGSEAYRILNFFVFLNLFSKRLSRSEHSTIYTYKK